MLTSAVQFDNLQASPVAGDAPIGIYLDLLFNGYSLIQELNIGVGTGVVRDLELWMG